MQFRDELLAGTPGLPKGLYWGIYLGDERGGAWKIDLWATNRQGFESVRRFGDELASRLNDENRAAIVSIKAACWQHPQYRRGFTSADVYAAVLDRGVRDVDAFWLDLSETKGIRRDSNEMTMLISWRRVHCRGLTAYAPDARWRKNAGLKSCTTSAAGKQD